MITVQLESMATALEEMKPLFISHHKELALFQDKSPLDPDYEKYAAAERNGSLVFVTARLSGKIIGYWVNFVALALHYKQTLMADMDILWVDPAFRGEKIGEMMYKCLREEFARRGVKVWYGGSKNHKAIEWFFEQLGFEPIEKRFALWVGQ